MTATELAQLPIAEQLRDERIAIMMEGAGLTEGEAVSILNQEQMQLPV